MANGLKLLNNKSQNGSISILVLIMSMVFATTIGGLVMFAAVEYTSGRRTESQHRALSIAEAGINYYKWHLVHDPNDYTDGTSQPGPYEHVYTDPEGGDVGGFSLEVTPPELGSKVVKVKSTGWSNEHPTVRRSVTAKIGPASLTKFSFLHNTNVWFGQGITVSGEIFSNGGIRMDGTHDSLVKSAKETYTCGTETGCWPPQSKPGVWGIGGPQELWQFPVTGFDFNNIVTDFSDMKTESQLSGVYLPPSSNFGYHLVFAADGSVSVYEVLVADSRNGWNADDVCENLFQTISDEQLIGVYQTSDKKLFYAEDTVWVDGTVSGQVNVVAARLPVESFTTNIWVNDNLTYDVQDGSTVLGLIAQNDIYFAYDIPQDFYVNAILLAQNGRVLRHHYNHPQCSHGGQAIRQNLTIYGSVISKKKSYWNFSGHGGVRSGFINRVVIYNQDAIAAPPPFFPTTGVIEVLSWDEDDI